MAVVGVRNTLFASLPSDPSDELLAELQGRVLQAMDEQQARGLVMDISALDAMDSYLARMVAETAAMVTLMGGRTVVAGMRPSVAVALTELGLSLGGAASALDVDAALDVLADWKETGEGG